MVTLVSEPTVDAIEQSTALAERLFQATLATWDIACVYLGHRLGLYRALANIEPAISTELATATGLSERYVREWLEQQAVAGLLDCENPDAAATARRYAFPAGYAAVLVEEDDPNYLAPLAQIVIGALHPMQALVKAFQTGDGVPYADFGLDLRAGQAGMNRNLFLQQLGTEYLPAISGLHERLLADPPARVADIGCGLGWSSIGIAKAYPKLAVDGFDLDEASVAEAPGDRARRRPRRPCRCPTARWRRSGAGRPLRFGHRLRVCPRHERPGRGPADHAPAGRR